jgi:hypothetical protein
MHEKLKVNLKHLHHHNQIYVIAFKFFVLDSNLPYLLQVPAMREKMLDTDLQSAY